ncbi:HAD-IA family hydrolase [Candidatus Woesebacteria bacterium]|nr:HAD-IA family hydrolase [Candidatus Woesebacteria bacterium]
MIKPTWVIFDVGGVLFDYMQAFEAIQDYLGVDGNYVKGIIDSHIGNEERGSITIESVFAAILSPIDKVPELERLITMWYDRKYWHEDTFKLMQELKNAGYHIAIMTNNWGNMSDRLRAMKGVEITEKIYESAVVGKRKPDLEFYDYIQQDLQVESSKLLLIDDLKANCEGAELAGWQSFIYDMGTDRGVIANDKLRTILL